MAHLYFLIGDMAIAISFLLYFAVGGNEYLWKYIYRKFTNKTADSLFITLTVVDVSLFAFGLYFMLYFGQQI